MEQIIKHLSEIPQDITVIAHTDFSPLKIIQFGHHAIEEIRMLEDVLKVPDKEKILICLVEKP